MTGYPDGAKRQGGYISRLPTGSRALLLYISANGFAPDCAFIATHRRVVDPYPPPSYTLAHLFSVFYALSGYIFFLGERFEYGTSGKEFNVAYVAPVRLSRRL